MSNSSSAVVQHTPEPEGDSSALMRIIERAALTPEFDVQKLQQLLEVKERWEATEARKAYVAAMTAFKSDPPSILKSKWVSIPGGANFAHATLAEVVDAACAGLSEHGLTHRWEVTQENGLVTVTCVLTHEMGHSERTTLSGSPDDSGKKNSIQQIASTVTYLERYTLLAATGLAAKDIDDDGRKAGSEPISEEQLTTITGLIKSSGADEAKFLEWIGAAKLEEIPASKFQQAVAQLKRKQRATQ